jgi:signal transduction histidine kinase
MVRLEAAAAPSSLSLGLVLFAAGFAAQGISALVGAHGGGDSLVWLPGGLLLATLMSVPAVRWPYGVGGALLGVVCAASISQEASLSAAATPVFTLMAVPVVARAMRSVWEDPSPMRTFRNLGWFIGLFVFALPVASSLFSAWAGRAPPQMFHASSQWLHVALAHALGYIVFAPIWFVPRARWASLKRLFVPVSWPALAALAAVVGIGMLWNAFGDVSYARPLLLLAPIPVLMFTALRARVAGAYLFIVLIAVLAIRLSAVGRGPFIEADAELTDLALKSWILAIAVASWLLAVLVEQRLDMRRALVDSSQQVRELAGRLIEAQERERSRIARDLHDDVSQRLASISIGLSAIRRSADEHSQVELASVQDELIALSEDVRHLSHNLHPSMLREAGLEAGLVSLCNAQRHRNGPEIVLRVSGNADRLSDAVALCVYRGAQEALANAVRHARATEIEVVLAIADDQAEICVRDDGVGFRATGEIARARGLGLLSLAERAKLLGGEFGLITSPGKGTKVCIRVPSHPRRPV